MTLIELIFSIVIIGVVFTVVPKLIFISNKSMELAMKEDALYSAYSMMGSILRLDWDENTTSDGKILDTDVHSCDDNRTGGFAGSRNCIDSDDSATAIGLEGSDYDDIDDYDGYEENISVGGKNRYKLTVSVRYVDNNYSQTGNKEELKEVNTTVEQHSDNKKIKIKSSFFYYSANLGHIQIKKEQWK